MKQLLTFSAIILASMSLTSLSKASANPSLESSPTSLQKRGSTYLIASPFRTEISPAHQRRRRLMELLILQMEMDDLAQEMMQSEDPEMKVIAEEIMSSSDAMSSKLMKMLQSSPRSLESSQEDVSKN